MKALLALLLVSSVAYADGDDAPAVEAPAPAPLAKPKAKKRFYFRAGVAFVDPLSQSNELELAGVDGPASLAISNGPIAGSGASIASSTIPAVIIGYVLPKWHDRVAIETILGTPLTVKMQATGTLATQSLAPTALGIPTGIMPLGPELGQADAVPPVVTLVYSLLADGPVRPYVGAGASVLIAYNARVTNPVLTSVGKPSFSIAPAPGLALQTGVEATIYGRIYARLDVKFIALMQARAEVHNIQMNAPDLPLFGTVEVGTAKMSMWVNPLIIQAGIGTDF
ncbi:MAG: OmpW/AlkL family protein [Acidobacteriota bacterium]